MMKNLGILILECFFLGLTFLWEVRQGISRNINLFLTVIDSKIILKELLGSTHLSKAQAFCIHELTEVIIVNEDKNLVFAAF